MISQCFWWLLVSISDDCENDSQFSGFHINMLLPKHVFYLFLLPSDSAQAIEEILDDFIILT